MNVPTDCPTVDRELFQPGGYDIFITPSWMIAWTTLPSRTFLHIWTITSRVFSFYQETALPVLDN